MKNQFKGLCMGLALCFSFTAVMTACGTAKVQKTDETKTQPTAAAAQKVTLKVMYSGYGKQQDTDKVIEEFNKRLVSLLPDTKADIEFVQAEQYEEKLRLIVSAGEQLDVANFGSGIGSTKNDLVVEARKGTMLPLDDLLKTVPDLKNVMPEGVWDRGRVDGKIYQVPIYQMVTDKFIGIKTQKELSDKYLDMPKLKASLFNNGVVTKETYDILTDYLKKLSANNELRKGVSVETMSWLPQKAYYSLYNWSFVVKKEDKTCKVLNYYAQPDVKMMFDVHTDWYKSGYVQKDILSMQNRRQFEKKLDGNVLAMTTQTVSDPAFPDIESDVSDTKQYGYPVATAPWAKNYVIAPGNLQGLILPRTCKNPERAIKFLEVTNTDKGFDLLELLGNGIEGTHFTRDTNGVPQPTVKNPTDSKYAGMRWNVGNNLVTSPKENDNYKLYTREVANKKAITMPLAGFKLDIESIKSELTQYDAVVKEFTLALYSGASPNEEELYNQMLDKMKKAGADKIQAEIQKQVDAYLKANPAK